MLVIESITSVLMLKQDAAIHLRSQKKKDWQHGWHSLHRQVIPTVIPSFAKWLK